MESDKFSVLIGTAFCKLGHECVPNVPFRDTGKLHSKPGRLVILNYYPPIRSTVLNHAEPCITNIGLFGPQKS